MTANLDSNNNLMKINNNIFSYIEKHKPEIVRFAKKLISIPTVNPPGECYTECVEFIESKLKSIGIKTKRVLGPKENRLGNKNFPRINLLGELNNNKRITLHLNGHYDVVPVTSNWTKEPFNPVVIKNKLYGRGAYDMKSGITMIIFALQTIKDLGINLGCNISVSFTPDEETGGYSGMKYLVENGYIKADAGIIAEPTQRYTIHLGHKGVLWLEVTVLGKPAHASLPEDGINAFDETVKLYRALKKYEYRLKNTEFKIKTNSKVDVYHPTIVVGGIVSGGIKINIVPDKIMFTIDRRVLPNENVDKVKQELLKIIKSSKVKTKVEVKLIASPAIINSSEKIVTTLSEAIYKVTNRKAKLKLASGFMDVRFFVNDAKIPCIAFGVDGENAHGNDEFAYVDSIIENTKILARTIVDYKN